ncbi:C-GCAxxG-C-C family (seleno)protein [Clostridium sp. JN-1]|jgi:C_GCAxxG_C_C family probable redox protein|uniref:C-GCAxxG-C-C family (seleno)protein n=1 Tax=Clostridium sp. JN-1 TaxID=2483110 RepID=UPI000F0B5491|nr:C-GCAxxG-C-C family (seleno)protein [Clostridium sp. JN-1]
MLKDYINKYYQEKYNLNCAETILYASNEMYNLNLDKKTLKTMAAFGGGMGIEDVCGAISGSLAVLGILFVKDKAHESDRIKKLSKEFFEKFQEKLNTKTCSELKSKYRNDEIRCSRIILTAAEILEDIISKNKEFIVK